jgi:hypothetical protein
MHRDLGVSSAFRPREIAPRRRVASDVLLERRLQQRAPVSLKAAQETPSTAIALDVGSQH